MADRIKTSTGFHYFSGRFNNVALRRFMRMVWAERNDAKRWRKYHGCYALLVTKEINEGIT